MKTYQQFCEDAASQYKAGMMAYHSSPEARLAARRRAAAEKSKRLASDFVERQKAKARKKQYHNEELQAEQHPIMKPNLYNQLVARRQATQKGQQIRHVHGELGAEARAQQAAKRQRLNKLTRTP